jgi:hypothetical protein
MACKKTEPSGGGDFLEIDFFDFVRKLVIVRIIVPEMLVVVLARKQDQRDAATASWTPPYLQARRPAGAESLGGFRYNLIGASEVACLGQAMSDTNGCPVNFPKEALTCLAIKKLK